MFDLYRLKDVIDICARNRFPITISIDEGLAQRYSVQSTDKKETIYSGPSLDDMHIYVSRRVAPHKYSVGDVLWTFGLHRKSGKVCFYQVSIHEKVEFSPSYVVHDMDS